MTRVNEPVAVESVPAKQESGSKTIRIWTQSITDLTVLPGYADTLKKHARRVCSPDTVIDVHGIRPGSYPNGLAPIQVTKYHWAEHLLEAQLVENIMRAEREGYDAVAISCFLDPAMEEARTVVDIPVVSSCETALLVSSVIGRSFGMLCIDEHMAEQVRTLVRAYGFQDRVKLIETLNPPFTEHELDRAFAGSPAFVERFSKQASRLVEAGVDVIIPAEGVINCALVRNQVHQVAGVPVLDSYGTLVAFAEMLVQLRRRAGLSVGRRGDYLRPSPDLVAHLRRVTIDSLKDAQDGNGK
jgi:Asp/Glu/hydantoin racemase